MSNTINTLKTMTPRQMVSFAGRIVKQCKDRASISAGLGDEDDFLQHVCATLIQFKAGARELLPCGRLDIVSCGMARGEARRNYMSLCASDADITEEADKEDEEEELTEEEFAVFLSEVDAPAERSIDDVDGLSALDKLLIKHDTQSNVRQAAQTKDLAAFFNITTRAVRLRKKKLHADLRERFNLPSNFFEETVEPPMPHLKKIVKEEKDPLANFVPLKINDFNAFRTIGIR